MRLNHCQRFGKRVKELRIEREITQEQLSERVGVFRTYMSRIETGVANPTLTMIHALADALEVSAATLLECRRRLKTDPPCRLKSDPGMGPARWLPAVDNSTSLLVLS